MNKSNLESSIIKSISKEWFIINGNYILCTNNKFHLAPSTRIALHFKDRAEAIIYRDVLLNNV